MLNNVSTACLKQSLLLSTIQGLCLTSHSPLHKTGFCETQITIRLYQSHEDQSCETAKAHRKLPRTSYQNLAFCSINYSKSHL